MDTSKLLNAGALWREVTSAVSAGEREFGSLDWSGRPRTFVTKRCAEILAENAPKAEPVTSEKNFGGKSELWGQDS